MMLASRVKSLFVFSTLTYAGLSAQPLASAQNGGNFVAGINYSAGPPTLPTNTGFYIGGIRPAQAISGDFNGDNIPDLVVAADCASSYLPGCPLGGSVVAVYLGNGDGTFKAPILNGASLPPSIRSITVGDFNHDGRLDVAAASDSRSTQDFSGGTITILLGNGDGTLTQAAQYAVNGFVLQANTLAVGDFNHDGKLDLVAGIGCANGCAQGQIAIYLGNNDGTLKAPVSYPAVGNSALVPVVADFNGDGNLDVIAESYYAPGDNSHSSIQLFKGNGDGTLQPPVTTLLPFGAQDLVFADFNSDGINDLAITGNSDVEILFGNGTNGVGNGTFQAPVFYSVGQYNQSIAVAYLTKDGKPDLVIGSQSNNTNTASLVINDGTGKFNIGPSYPLGGWNTASVAVADFNLDGKSDIVLTSNCSETSSLDNHCPDGTLGVLLGNGDGTMQGAVPANLAVSPTYTVLADMNGDKILDIVGTENCYQNNCGTQQGGVIVALGLGDGQFGPSMEFPATVQNPRGLAVADLNGDGQPDVIVNGYGTSSSAIAVLLGNKDGSVGSPSTYALTEYAVGPPVVADFAGNKKLGVAVVQESSNNSPSGVGILLGNGDGSLQPEVFTATPEIYPLQLVAGDFNKDGKADIGAIGQVTGFGYDTGVTVLLGSGDGRLTVKREPADNPSLDYLYICDSQNACAFLSSYPTYGIIGTFGPETAPLAVADLNGDGNLDLIIANDCRLNDSGCSTGSLIVLPGNGDGTFSLAGNIGPAKQLFDASYVGVSVADVNGDGKPDIIASTLSGVAVYLWPFQSGTIYATSGRIYASIPAIGDLNGDGAPDIAVSNGSTVELLFNRFPATPTPAVTLTVTQGSGTAYGQPVTISATETPSLGIAQGYSWTINDGTNPIVKNALSNTVEGFTLITTSLSVGQHCLEAVFSSSISGEATGTSNLVCVNIVAAAPAITFTVVNRTYGTAPFNVLASSNSPGAISYSVLSGPATISGSTVTLTGVGTVILQAAQAASGNYTAGVQTAKFTVAAPARIQTSTSLAAQPSTNLKVGEALIITATVKAVSGTGIPTGTVTIASHAGGPALTIALDGTGKAVYKTVAPPPGMYSLFATYNGAPGYTGSVSPTITATVGP